MARSYAAKGISRAGAYRSGLEDKVSKQLESKGIAFDYEIWKIPYTIPESFHIYTPDFLLPNGIFIETKGLWDSDDRKKHQLIREQYPELDIRLVFSSSRSKLYKGSKTSYAEWCEKRGILFADKLIPVEWLKEKPKEVPFDKLKRKK
ncbi:endonuclease [Morganella phage vB_MmoP_MP2]|uniref:Endonuclease I n=1 Tax=Morganella phage vB_MmoP_MP2 TaxID=1852627 RepID=A0A192YB53_9CAUD|nr:endonuclease [Morganella phage vB_MmoP_MP2]ANM46360.1 endonuclease I [Morganella phage vB_MmoP_MP2]